MKGRKPTRKGRDASKARATVNRAVRSLTVPRGYTFEPGTTFEWMPDTSSAPRAYTREIGR